MSSERARTTSEELEDRNKSLQIEERRVADVNPNNNVNLTNTVNTTLSQDGTEAVMTDQPVTAPPEAETTIHPGWTKLHDEELPQATYWPVVMAFAITLVVFGFVTTVVITIVGLFLFVVSLIGWIGDMRNESHGTH